MFGTSGTDFYEARLSDLAILSSNFSILTDLTSKEISRAVRYGENI